MAVVIVRSTARGKLRLRAWLRLTLRNSECKTNHDNIECYTMPNMIEIGRLLRAHRIRYPLWCFHWDSNLSLIQESLEFFVIYARWWHIARLPKEICNITSKYSKAHYILQTSALMPRSLARSFMAKLNKANIITGKVSEVSNTYQRQRRVKKLLEYHKMNEHIGMPHSHDPLLDAKLYSYQKSGNNRKIRRGNNLKAWKINQHT